MQKPRKSTREPDSKDMFGFPPPIEKTPPPKNWKEALQQWFTHPKKQKLIINVALFGVGIYLTSSFKELSFEAPPLPQPVS